MDRIVPQVCGYSNDEERNQRIEAYQEEIMQKKIKGEIEDPGAVGLFNVVYALLYQYQQDSINRILDEKPRQFTVYEGKKVHTFVECDALAYLLDYARKREPVYNAAVLDEYNKAFIDIREFQKKLLDKTNEIIDAVNNLTYKERAKD